MNAMENEITFEFGANRRQFFGATLTFLFIIPMVAAMPMNLIKIKVGKFDSIQIKFDLHSLFFFAFVGKWLLAGGSCCGGGDGRIHLTRAINSFRFRHTFAYRFPFAVIEIFNAKGDTLLTRYCHIPYRIFRPRAELISSCVCECPPKNVGLQAKVCFKVTNYNSN